MRAVSRVPRKATWGFPNMKAHHASSEHTAIAGQVLDLRQAVIPVTPDNM